ncbi:MAG: hypothetical protein V3U93_03245 [Alphaproteobacteria bacterium]
MNGLTTFAKCAHHVMMPSQPSDLDIYRSVNQQGDEAPIHAAMRADELLDAGDLEGAAVWRRIVSAINELLADKPGDGAHIH